MVQSAARFTTSVEYRVRLTNNYDKEIVINSNRAADPIVLATSDGTYKKPITAVLGNQALKLSKDNAREYVLTYNINDVSDFHYYNILILRDVGYEGLSGTNNVQFNIQ